MMRLDHNRALAMLAKAASAEIEDIEKLAVWGNHSPTMFADIEHATLGGVGIGAMLPAEWSHRDFMRSVAQRGTDVINASGASSAASAAEAALSHMRDWIFGSDGRWVSMGVFTEGQLGFDHDLVIGIPTVCNSLSFSIPSISLSQSSREKIEASVAELREERSAVSAYLGS